MKNAQKLLFKNYNLYEIHIFQNMFYSKTVRKIKAINLN